VSGGDCGACCLAGLLNTGVLEAYELHESGYYGRGPLDLNPAKEIPKQSSFSYHSMDRTLTHLFYEGTLDRYINDPPIWLINQNIEMNGAWGASSLLMASAFINYCLAMFDAGYYGIAQVNLQGDGPYSRGGTNHWVMLCGARRRRYQEGDRTFIAEEVLVGDSAWSQPRERWIGWREFLEKHGGFMAFFARPAQ